MQKLHEINNFFKEILRIFLLFLLILVKIQFYNGKIYFYYSETLEFNAYQIEIESKAFQF